MILFQLKYSLLLSPFLFASELMRLIYLSVEVLGGIAIVILVVSYIAHKIKVSNEPKVYEAKIDKEKELKMILKDEKTNKEIVKGALSTKDNKKKKQTSVPRKQPTARTSHGKPSASHSSRSVSKKSSANNVKSSTSTPRIPKIKKKLPSRDTRIQILNSLSKTHSDEKNKNKKEDNNSFKKFYDISDE